MLSSVFHDNVVARFHDHLLHNIVVVPCRPKFVLRNFVSFTIFSVHARVSFRNRTALSSVLVGDGSSLGLAEEDQRNFYKMKMRS